MIGFLADLAKVTGACLIVGAVMGFLYGFIKSKIR